MGVQLDSGGGKKKGIKPNINVTPLVDVVLVLLIIFMVVLPNVQDGKTIEMVKVAAADQNADDTEPLSITIDRQQVCTFVDVDMTIAECVANMRQEYAANPRRRVLLRGDASVPYRVMRGLFHEAQEIGYGGVALAVGVAAEWQSQE